MGAIASVIGLGFNILLNTVIDPDLYENTLAVTIEKTREVYDAQGVDEAAAEKGIEMVKSMTPDMKKPSTMMLSLVMQMVFAAIGSAIVGAIIKKQDPEFANF